MTKRHHRLMLTSAIACLTFEWAAPGRAFADGLPGGRDSAAATLASDVATTPVAAPETRPAGPTTRTNPGPTTRTTPGPMGVVDLDRVAVSVGWREQIQRHLERLDAQLKHRRMTTSA